MARFYLRINFKYNAEGKNPVFQLLDLSNTALVVFWNWYLVLSLGHDKRFYERFPRIFKVVHFIRTFLFVQHDEKTERKTNYQKLKEKKYFCWFVEPLSVNSTFYCLNTWTVNSNDLSPSNKTIDLPNGWHKRLA